MEPPFIPAEAADAGEILTLSRGAFVAEAQIYGDPLLPPLTETLAEVAGAIEEIHVLKAVVGHRIIATGRARQEGTALHLGRFAVAPDFQGRGLGTRLIAALEALAAPGTEHFELFTGMRSELNLKLYDRLGYKETRRSPGRPGIELVHLRKPAA
ncbi:GNAT family N-acetyltransferase [Glycomyces harbinensis]|uniref:Acetyltransferase (GNAT) domain-containing protein n=1 Tax=Glycomyces harbinensis TaxID=58114 RepID=A0A1G6T4L8_9ACTN|nr:GNAT family N-acetyltransferase [Glycomyces harbinensis]SDD23486.1 Acetyltransferase (GNAT) domain-containing protein [Glycomyces harbinensis]